MLALPNQDGDSPLAVAYREYVRGMRLRQAKIGYLLPLALVPLALSLDYFVYPKLFGPLFKSRLICDLLLLPLFAALYTKLGQRFIRILGNAWLIAPMLSICWMIYASEGALSPYYAGLNLVMLAGSLLTTYRVWQAVYFSIFVFVSYGIACLIHHVHTPATALQTTTMTTSSTLFNNCYFLVATGTVCVTAAYFSSRRRYEDFCLRHNLDTSNKELAATLKKLQETEVQLVQSEKMNALGKLSAGLLHEVNNPLNFTFMALEMAQQEAEGNESLVDTLKDIGQGMTRIRGVISDLRAFAYPTKVTDREEFLVEESLTTAIRLTAHELGDITVERRGLDSAKVVGAKTQLVHVFMNLLVNSVQAMKKTSADRKPMITVSGTPKGERIEIAVRDNGCGVKASDLPKLLDPFFTTKDVGEGMGLGLSICHTIVKNHGGNIDITTEEGRWTQVAFDLQMAGSDASRSDESTTAPWASAGQTAILVGSNT